MNHIHKRRLYYIIFATISIVFATGLVLYALKKNINAFMTPSQYIAASYPLDHRFQLGGMVKQDSIIRAKHGLGVQFTVTDFKHEITVDYDGILPDLFREGKGVIVAGSVNHQGIFIATAVLAKHDENYIPPPLRKVMRDNQT